MSEETKPKRKYTRRIPLTMPATVDAGNDPEPEKSIELGDLTPAWIEWFKRNHTEEEFFDRYLKKHRL